MREMQSVRGDVEKRRTFAAYRDGAEKAPKINRAEEALSKTWYY